MKSEKLMKNLKCPDCGKDLRGVIAESQYGIKIKLDQCFYCGGIWFDGFELYPIPKGEIERIENINLEKLQENVLLAGGDKNCPKCGVKLDDFKDNNFPKQLEAECCGKCGGIWMNRGEATEFKLWQEEKKNSSANPSDKDKEFQKSLRELLETSRNNSFESVGKMGKLLSLKIDPISKRPLNAGDYGSEEYNKAQEAVSIAMNIIYMLLRLFLKI